MNERIAHIEALLFALGRPLSKDELAQKLSCTKADIEQALGSRAQGGRGIVLVDDGAMVELRTAPEAAGLIETIRKEEYSRDIGRAGLEVLCAILYRGPMTRAEIDFIRGVNSSQTLRTLGVRGLVRKAANPKDRTADGRRSSAFYEPTTELLAELGVTHQKELPEYDAVRAKLRALEDAYRAKEANQPQDDL